VQRCNTHTVPVEDITHRLHTHTHTHTHTHLYYALWQQNTIVLDPIASIQHR